jgi:hypothetical protein|nr:hypothetical protein [Spirochaetales bacterium]
MDATGVDSKTASDVLYGSIGSNEDTRDWASIMSQYVNTPGTQSTNNQQAPSNSNQQNKSGFRYTARNASDQKEDNMALNVGANYQKLFGRDGKSEGVNFWQTAADNNGWSQAKLDSEMIGGAAAPDRAFYENSQMQEEAVSAAVQAAPVSAPNQTLADPVHYQATDYEAKTGTVNDNSLVSKQMEGLLAQNSPYLQRAQAISSQRSNQRGLLNSSMASQAGTAAAIDAAMPIATQDAGTYSQQDLANQQVINSQRQFGATAQNQANGTNAAADNSANQAQFQGDVSNAQFNAGETNAANARNNQIAADAAKLKSQQAAERLKMEMDVNARNWDSYNTAYTNINLSDISNSAKDTMINDLSVSLEGQMSMSKYFADSTAMEDGSISRPDIAPVTTSTPTADAQPAQDTVQPIMNYEEWRIKNHPTNPNRSPFDEGPTQNELYAEYTAYKKDLGH